MKKSFYIFWEYLCNLTLIISIFMVAYLCYLGYHVLRWWFATLPPWINW